MLLIAAGLLLNGVVIAANGGSTVSADAAMGSGPAGATPQPTTLGTVLLSASTRFGLARRRPPSPGPRRLAALMSPGDVVLFAGIVAYIAGTMTRRRVPRADLGFAWRRRCVPHRPRPRVSKKGVLSTWKPRRSVSPISDRSCLVPTTVQIRPMFRLRDPRAGGTRRLRQERSCCPNRAKHRVRSAHVDLVLTTGRERSLQRHVLSEILGDEPCADPESTDAPIDVSELITLIPPGPLCVVLDDVQWRFRQRNSLFAR